MKLILILLFSLFINTIHAQTYESELELRKNQQEFKAGDIVEATLRIWPLESLNDEDKQRLIDQSFLGVFKILTAPNIHPSENNADILEIELRVLITGSTDKINNEIEVNGQKIKVTLKNIKITPLSLNEKSYVYADQSLINANMKIILIGFLAIIAIGYIIYRIKFKKIKKTQSTQNNLKILIENAKERNDFEKIYSQREVFLRTNLQNGKVLDDFFSVLNKYQYKKEWTTQELNEVQESFQKIKGGINVQ